MPSSLAAAAAGINNLSISKNEEPKKPAEPKKSSLLAAVACSSTSSAPSSSNKSNQSKKTAAQGTRNKDTNHNSDKNTNKKKQQKKPQAKSSLSQQTKPKEKVVAQFEFSLDSSGSEHEESSKHTSRPKHKDQRERKIDVAVSKRLIGHALNQKSTHRNGNLYGDSVDDRQGNRNHGNRRYHDDGSNSTLRHSNRNKDKRSEYEKRHPRKNRSDGPPAPRNDRWNKDISSSKLQNNRQSNKKYSGNNRQNESVSKPNNTEPKKPEFNIISSSEAIGVAAASNWAEDSDSDEGW